MKNVLLTYRLKRFEQEIKPVLDKYNGDNVYIILQNDFEKLSFKNMRAFKNENYNTNNIYVYSVSNLLEGDLDYMKNKFDYIVGNPPYQGSGDDSSKKIYFEITSKAIELLKPEGVISFITPTAILTTGQKSKTLGLNKIFTDKLVEVNFKANDDFNIGQTVCQWKLKNSTNKNGIKLIYSDDTTETVHHLYECVDNHNKVSQIITNKITYEYNENPLHTKLPIGQSNQARCANNIVSEKTDEHTVEVYCNTKEQRIKYCKPSDTRKNKFKRIIIEYSGDWKVEPFISDIEVNALMFVNQNKLSDKELENLKSILVSKLYSYAIVYDKISGQRSSGLYNLLFNLTSPGLHKNWTDEELYNEFNITEDEQKVIEDWYKEWKK